MDAELFLHPYQMPSIVYFLEHPHSSTFAILAESDNNALRHLFPYLLFQVQICHFFSCFSLLYYFYVYNYSLHSLE